MKARDFRMPQVGKDKRLMQTLTNKSLSKFSSISRMRRITSVGKSFKRQYSTKKNLRNTSLASTGTFRNGSFDLAPKVRKNKNIKPNNQGLFGHQEIGNDYYELEKITSFLRTSLRSKNIKEFIKSNQQIFDTFINRVDSGKWRNLDLRSMHGFFIKCFKNNVSKTLILY